MKIRKVHDNEVWLDGLKYFKFVKLMSAMNVSIYFL